jgi:hypothetical protein
MNKEVFFLPLWIFILLCSGCLISIGFLIDLAAKKKNYYYDLEEGLKDEREKRH